MSDCLKQFAGLWLVGESEELGESRSCVITSLVLIPAPDRETAIATYMSQVAVQDPSFLENVAMAEYFPYAAIDEGGLPDDLEPAHADIRAFFGEHAEWARIAIAHFNDPTAEGVAEEVAKFPHDMLMYILTYDPRWATYVAIPLDTLPLVVGSSE